MVTSARATVPAAKAPAAYAAAWRRRPRRITNSEAIASKTPYPTSADALVAPVSNCTCHREADTPSGTVH